MLGLVDFHFLIYFMHVINIVKVNYGNYQCIFRTLLSCSTVILFGFITALHVMQTRYCDENSVRPSVRLSVRLSVHLSICHTRVL